MMKNEVDVELCSYIKWLVSIVVVCFISIWGYYNFVSPSIYIWQKSKAGQAELAHAEYSRQIATCEALAKKMSHRLIKSKAIV